MRICVVLEGNSLLPPEKGGGIEAAIVTLVKGCTDRGHEVSIVCGKVGDRSKLEGVKFCKLKRIEFLGVKINEVLYCLEAFLFLLINWRRFDLFQFDSYQFRYLFLAFVFKSLTKRHVIYATHAHHLWDLEYEQMSLARRFNIKLRAFCKRRMDKIITPSAKIRENIIKYAKGEPSKIKAIHRAIDTDLFHPRYGKGARHTLGLDDDDFVILFVGRLVDEKGVEYLLRAAPIVKKEVDRAKFVLVGGGWTGVDIIPQGWLVLCKELNIEDDVIFTGTVSYEMLAQIYSSADIFALPTMMEAFCLAVFEAAASGLPVVCTDCADIPLLISECGIVVEKRDEVDLANAIIRLAKDKKLRESYANKARDVAKEKLSIDRFLNEHEQVYAECLEGK
jgi:glycosyltransferase involved in cell wall biosynthesis